MFAPILHWWNFSKECFLVILDWKTRAKCKYVGRECVWESSDCVLLCVCAAGVVLQWPWTQSSPCDAGGWWASRPHLTPPPGQSCEKLWGVGVGSSETGGKNIQETSHAWECGEVTEHCSASSDSVLQRLPLGYYSQITWDRKHLLLETRIDDFLTSRLLYLNRTNKADVFIQMVGNFRGLSSSIGF